MRAHVFQHVAFEGLGNIKAWLAKNGYELSYTRFFRADELPDPRTIDFLVIMGGPMSVNDESALPWLKEERRFVRRFIESDKPVLGICLGAQMIAKAMGAKVYPHHSKEVGWFPISSISSAAQNAFQLPSSTMAFHWHGETFDLPTGALHLARSKGCEHQAFQLGAKAIGIQCHLEATEESVAELVAHCAAELTPASHVQSAAEIGAAPLLYYRSMRQQMERLLSYLTSKQKPV